MAKRILSELKEVEPRESLYSIDQLINLCSRKDINQNGDINSDLIEVTLCFANEIKRLQDEIKELNKSKNQQISQEQKITFDLNSIIK